MSEPVRTPENDAPTTAPEGSVRDDPHCKEYHEFWEIDFTKEDVDAVVTITLEFLRFLVFQTQFIVWTITIPISMVSITAFGLYMGNHSNAARLKIVAIVGSCVAVMCALFGVLLWHSFRRHVDPECLSLTPNLKRVYTYFCKELRPALYFCIVLFFVNVYGAFRFWYEMGSRSIFAPIVDCADVHN